MSDYTFNQLVIEVAKNKPELRKILVAETQTDDISIPAQATAINEEVIKTKATYLGNLITHEGKKQLLDRMHQANITKHDVDREDITKAIHDILDPLSKKLSIFFDEIISNPKLYGATKKAKVGLGDGLVTELQTTDGYRISVDEVDDPSLAAAVLNTPDNINYAYDDLRYGNPKQVTSIYSGTSEVRVGDTLAKVDQGEKSRLIVRSENNRTIDNEVDLEVRKD